MRELEKVVGDWSRAVPLLQVGYRGITNTVLTTGSCCLLQNNLCLCVQMLLVTVLASEDDEVEAAVTQCLLGCSAHVSILCCCQPQQLFSFCFENTSFACSVVPEQVPLGTGQKDGLFPWL